MTRNQIRVIVSALLAVAGLGAWIFGSSVGGELTFQTNPEGNDLAEVRVLQVPLQNRELAGEEPAERADLYIDVEVDVTGGKNRLVYTIGDLNGNYVETFAVDFWYVTDDTMSLEDSPLHIPNERINNFVPAGEELIGCIEVVTAGELRKVGGSIGKSENWHAQINWYGRARSANPSPLPELVQMNKCR